MTLRPTFEGNYVKDNFRALVAKLENLTLQRLIDCTPWETWYPVYGSASGTYSGVTTDYARYRKIGKKAEFQLRAYGTLAGATTYYFTFTLPVDSVYDKVAFVANGVDSVGRAARCYYQKADEVVRVFRADGTNWSTGSNREIRVTGNYEIA